MPSLAERVAQDVNPLSNKLARHHIGDPLPGVVIVTALRRKVRTFRYEEIMRPVERRDCVAEVTVWEHESGPVATLVHGVGGPSTDRIMLSALQRGAKVVIRVGTCGLLAAGAPIGSVVAVDSATGDDTAFEWYRSRRGDGWRDEDFVRADETLLGAALSTGDNRVLAGPVYSTSLICREDDDKVARYLELGCVGADMEVSTILAAARRYRFPAIGVLLGGDNIVDALHHSSAEHLFAEGVSRVHSVLNAVLPVAQKLAAESQ